MTKQVDLSDLIADIKDVDGVKTLDQAAYEKHGLTDGLTIADVKRVEAANASYRARSVQALALSALEDLVADPKKSHIDTVAHYGSQSTIRNRVRREHTVGKGDNAKRFFGHSTVVVSNGDEPELLDAIEQIGKRGAELFGSK